MATNKPAKNQSTTEFIEISEIRDTAVILKNGSLRALLEVSSLNFELKSDDEKTAIITAFQDFLNAVDFPLQIAVNSRKLDVKPYLASLETLSAGLDNELLKIQAT